MLNLLLPALDRPLELLCLGAHADDLEIGCGGTLLRLLTERRVNVRWVVLGAPGDREAEARASAQALLGGTSAREIEIRGFRNSFFPYQGREIKEEFEEMKRSFLPDLILTHARGDLHQDHRLVNELTWNTFRDHLILEYEIPKYDGDLGRPNLFVALDDQAAGSKIDHLLQYFPSQRARRWFDEETFRGLMRLRGVEAGVRYAEAFYCRKATLGSFRETNTIPE